MKILLQIIKITILACVFSLAIHISVAYLGEQNDNQKKAKYKLEEVSVFSSGNNNKHKFQKSHTQILAHVGVAISTNIGIKFKQRGNNNLYQSIPGLSQAISATTYANNSALSKHLVIVGEYYNILKTDIKSMIDKSYNKSETLSAYIDQLQYRHKAASAYIYTLEKKKKQLLVTMNEQQEKINRVKNKINKDFKAFNAKETNLNIAYYLEKKGDYTYTRTQIIFINQYLKQYKYLNNYNKKLASTLIQNKEAIQKSAYIVIPNNGTEILNDMKLIISEEEYKTQ